MDRQHRRELKHDKFVDEVGSLTTRARENQRLLLAITLGVVVFAVLAYGFMFYRANREKKGQQALSAAIEAMDSPLVQEGTPNPSARFKTEEERISKVEPMFRAVREKYSSTDAADVAGLYLARFAAGRNDVATARKLLTEFVDDHPQHVLVGGARYSLYELRIGNGEAQQVASELNQELSKQKDHALPQDALLALLAKAYDAQGNPQQARETYRRIVTQFPESPYMSDAQRRAGS